MYKIFKYGYYEKKLSATENFTFKMRSGRVVENILPRKNKPRFMEIRSLWNFLAEKKNVLFATRYTNLIRVI